MTQAEKAKRYDEALEKARSFYKRWDGISASDSNLVIAEVKEIFPELKESSTDEKIKRFLIDFIKVCGWSEKQFPPREECIAWLEKQGEQEEPQVYETEDDEVITYSESEGYKVVEPKFKVGDIV